MLLPCLLLLRLCQSVARSSSSSGRARRSRRGTCSSSRSSLCLAGCCCCSSSCCSCSRRWHNSETTPANSSSARRGRGRGRSRGRGWRRELDEMDALALRDLVRVLVRQHRVREKRRHRALDHFAFGPRLHVAGALRPRRMRRQVHVQVIGLFWLRFDLAALQKASRHPCRRLQLWRCRPGRPSRVRHGRHPRNSVPSPACVSPRRRGRTPYRCGDVAVACLTLANWPAAIFGTPFPRAISMTPLWKMSMNSFLVGEKMSEVSTVLVPCKFSSFSPTPVSSFGVTGVPGGAWVRRA